MSGLDISVVKWQFLAVTLAALFWSRDTVALAADKDSATFQFMGQCRTVCQQTISVINFSRQQEVFDKFESAAKAAKERAASAGRKQPERSQGRPAPAGDFSLKNDQKETDQSRPVSILAKMDTLKTQLFMMSTILQNMDRKEVDRDAVKMADNLSKDADKLLAAICRQLVEANTKGHAKAYSNALRKYKTIDKDLERFLKEVGRELDGTYQKLSRKHKFDELLPKQSFRLSKAQQAAAAKGEKIELDKSQIETIRASLNAASANAGLNKGRGKNKR